MAKDTTLSAQAERRNAEELSQEERRWVDSQVAHFDDLLRINYGKSVEAFCELIIEALCETLNALRGAFYLVDQESNVTYAVAGYACTLDHLEHTEFEMGDGLIGQCAASAKPMYFPALPPKNAVVPTGLAELSAKSLLALPLVFNEKVYGVLEVAHMRPLQQKELRLLGVLSRNVASILQSIISNERNKVLIEEMRAQEEEMKQSNEELMTTQEEMSKRQKELEQKERQIERINENVPGIIYQFTITQDGQFVFTYITQGVKRILGYTPEEINEAQNTDKEFIHPEDVGRFQESLMHSMQTLEDFKWEGRLRKKQGGYHWLKAVSHPQKGDDGTIVWDGVMEDIQELMETQNELSYREAMMQQKDQYLDTLTRNMPDILFQLLKDQDSEALLFVSPSSESMLGYEPEEMEEAYQTEGFIAEADRPAFQESLEHSFRSLEDLIWEGKMKMKDGNYLRVRIVARPEYQEDDSVVWSGVIQDLSRLEAAEQEVHQRNKSLQETLQRARQTENKLEQALEAKEQELQQLREQLEARNAN